MYKIAIKKIKVTYSVDKYWNDEPCLSSRNSDVNYEVIKEISEIKLNDCTALKQQIMIDGKIYTIESIMPQVGSEDYMLILDGFVFEDDVESLKSATDEIIRTQAKVIDELKDKIRELGKPKKKHWFQ